LRSFDWKLPKHGINGLIEANEQMDSSRTDPEPNPQSSPRAEAPPTDQARSQPRTVRHTIDVNDPDFKGDEKLLDGAQESEIPITEAAFLAARDHEESSTQREEQLGKKPVALVGDPKAGSACCLLL
jgi:hypothetical protein